MAHAGENIQSLAVVHGTQCVISIVRELGLFRFVTIALTMHD